MSDSEEQKSYDLAGALPAEFAGARMLGAGRSVLSPGSFLLHAGESRVFGAAPTGWTGHAHGATLVGGSNGANFGMTLVRADCGATFARSVAEDGSDRAPALFMYVLTGALRVNTNGRVGEVGPGCFLYDGVLGSSVRVSVVRDATSVVVISKEFARGAGRTFGEVVVGDEEAVRPEKVFAEMFSVRKLLSRREATAGFNVHIMDFQPGQHLNAQEVHMKHHGVLLLQGKGICMLNQRYFPVSTGDAVWMAPTASHWYGALGTQGTRCLMYTEEKSRLFQIDF